LSDNTNQIIIPYIYITGGAAVLTSLVDGLSVEFATVLVAAVIGSYTFIGGLGATFYVSYFNTALIYIVMIIIIQKVYNDSGETDNPLGNA
jgi:Na+/proline symporter